MVIERIIVQSVEVEIEDGLVSGGGYDGDPDDGKLRISKFATMEQFSEALKEFKSPETPQIDHPRLRSIDDE